jgi:hypothetical protein
MRHDTSRAKGAAKLQDCKFGFMGHILLTAREYYRHACERAHAQTHTQKSVGDQSELQQLNNVKEVDYRKTSINGKTTESAVLIRK